jgi:tetratricopeptide (TPR) repeat protein
MRGISKASLGYNKEAIIDYDKSIELDPKNKFRYYNRGVAKHKLGDVEGACHDWSKAGELGISDAYTLIKQLCK